MRCFWFDAVVFSDIIEIMPCFCHMLLYDGGGNSKGMQVLLNVMWKHHPKRAKVKSSRKVCPAQKTRQGKTPCSTRKTRERQCDEGKTDTHPAKQTSH